MSSALGTPLQKVWARGPKILLQGLEGTGKTDAIRTLLEAGLKVFVVFLEPGMEVLSDGRRGRKVYTCAEGLHWRYIPVATPSFSELKDAADLINKFDFKTLSNMAPTNTKNYRAMYELMNTMATLKCDRCGTSFGPADHLKYDEWCVVNDSLTSISKAALLGHIGSKPGVSQGEFGMTMRQIEGYLDKFTNDMPCMGVLLAHVDKEPNEITGGTENMVSTLGQKLAPKIPRPFSDVVLAIREADKFRWSTTTSGYKLKTRNFAFSDQIPATFKPVVEAWRKQIKDEEAAALANEQMAAAGAATAPKP